MDSDTPPQSLLLNNCKLHLKNKINRFCIECDRKLCEDCEHLCEFNGSNFNKTVKHLEEFSVKFYNNRLSRNQLDADAYFQLGRTLRENRDHTTVELWNGELWTELKLYLKSLEIDENNSNALYNIVVDLDVDSDETIVINGSDMGVLEIYTRILEIDPKDSDACYNLANYIGVKDIPSVVINDVEMDQEYLFKKSIQINPNDELGYNSLGLLLDNNEDTIELFNGQILNQRELYVKSLEISPEFDDALNNLGSTLDDDEKITVNGVEMDNKSLFIKAIESSDDCPPVFYQNLLDTLSDDEIVEVNGESLTKEDLKDLYYQNEPITKYYTYILEKIRIKACTLVFDKNIEQEIKEYYSTKDNKVRFQGKLISYDKYFEMFYNEDSELFVNSILRILFYSLTRGADLPRINYHFIALLKSLERFLISSNDIKLFKELFTKIEFDKLNEIFFPLIIILLKAVSHPSDKNKKIVYESILPMKNSGRRSSYLLETIGQLDKYYGKNVLGIHKETQDYVSDKFHSFFSSQEYSIERLLDVINYHRYGALPYGKDYTEKFIKLKHYDHFMYYNELGSILEENPDLEELPFKSAKECYLKSIQITQYHPDAYYSLGKLLKENETVQFNNTGKIYSKIDLYILSIQLGNRNSSIFYHLALLLGSQSKRKVKIEILNEQSSNQYYGYFDFICQSIYHDLIVFNVSTYRYYLSLVSFLKSI